MRVGSLLLVTFSTLQGRCRSGQWRGAMAARAPSPHAPGLASPAGPALMPTWCAQIAPAVSFGVLVELLGM